ncbi:MAG: hypothetical protein VX899_12725 [Myxococcota bacterium]|nr:hypothetical protein [Myxococcota bacterium]
MRDHSPGLRSTIKLIAVAVPIAILAFLALGGWFDSYHGQAVSWRPLDQEVSEDGDRKVLIVRPGQQLEERVLPASTTKGLPLERQALPPMEVPVDAPVVHKDPFSFAVSVDNRKVSTLQPAALILPLLGVVLAVLARNLLTTGSAFSLDPAPGGDLLPGVRQEQAGVPAPTKQTRGQQGPPPPKGGRGRRKGKGRKGRRPR